MDTVIAMLPVEAVDQMCPRVGDWGVFHHRLVVREAEGPREVALVASHQTALRLADGLNHRRRLSDAARRVVETLALTDVGPAGRAALDDLEGML